MNLRKITLSTFRNVTLATLRMEGTRQFMVGLNGQGKTNLIEAAGCLTALRSFRTSESRHMIQDGQPEAAIACVVDREGTGTESVVIKVRGDGKALWRNDKRVTR
ncbi:MAG TPA: DNA replication and repair protein RecF, partial [Opitutaceae bacterium]